MTKHIPMALLVPALLLSACNEYELVGTSNEAGAPEDSDGGGDDGDGGTVLPPDCAEFDDFPDEAVTTNDECEVEYSTGSFTPVVEWTWGSSSFCGPPAVGQIVDSNRNGVIDDDDMPVIVLYQSGKVVALYGDGSGPAWSTNSASYGQDGGFAIGDVDEDGWPDVVTASASSVCALDGASGTQLWCTNGLSANLDGSGYS